MDSSTSLVPTLPGDIIAQICQQIFANPLHQYNLSLSGGQHSQWSKDLQFCTSLPLVSKLWWKPATRGLYNHIVIRRLRRTPYLARTLSSKDAGINFGSLVRKITLYECLVVLPDWNVKPNSLRTVFQRCVALEELSFHRHPDGEDTITDSEDEIWWGGCQWRNPLWMFPKVVFPALLARGPTALRKLDLASFDYWGEKKIEAPLHRLIRACPRLTSLALRVYHPHSRKLPTLDALEELYLDFHGQAPKPASKAAVWMWDLPRLRSLAVVNVPDGLPTVLERLGRALTYLHLCSATPCTGTGTEGFARIPALCPALEHLVFCPTWQAQSPVDGICALLEAAAVPFQRLRYLDLWLTRAAKRRRQPQTRT